MKTKKKTIEEKSNEKPEAQNEEKKDEAKVQPSPDENKEGKKMKLPKIVLILFKI